MTAIESIFAEEKCERNTAHGFAFWRTFLCCQLTSVDSDEYLAAVEMQLVAGEDCQESLSEFFFWMNAVQRLVNVCRDDILNIRGV